MIVRVRYLAQLRNAAGLSTEEIEIDPASRVADLLGRLAGSRPKLRGALLDAQGKMQRTLLIFIGDEQVRGDYLLQGGEEISLMTPIAGG